MSKQSLSFLGESPDASDPPLACSSKLCGSHRVNLFTLPVARHGFIRLIPVVAKRSWNFFLWCHMAFAFLFPPKVGGNHELFKTYRSKQHFSTSSSSCGLIHLHFWPFQVRGSHTDGSSHLRILRVMVHMIQNWYQDYSFPGKGKIMVDILMFWVNGGFLIILEKYILQLLLFV